MFELGNANQNLLSIKSNQNKYYEEKIKINLQDSNDSHAILAKEVKENSVCLDVGCAVGYTGELLCKDKNCIVYGIEIDNQAIEIAKKKNCYQEIFNFSITDSENPHYKAFFQKNIQFDYIIFADILEHLVDPGKILYEFSKILKPDGAILVSVPNVAHMDISKNLIDRTFNYNVTGLLDNSHIRFFTKNSFIQMINNVNKNYKLNLKIQLVGKTIVVPPYASKYPNLYKILNEDEELCVLQYIYRIEKSSTIIQNSCSKQQNNYDKIEKQLSERNAFLEKIHEQEELIHNYQKQIQDHEERIKKIIEEKEERIKKIIEEKEEINQQLQENIQEIQKILNSRSWKITEPLRKVTTAMNRKR